MRRSSGHAAVLLFLVTFGLVAAVSTQTPLREAHPDDDFTVREEMIPMRDGVKLYTIVLAPKDASRPLPILLERTPYDATRRFAPATTRLAVAVSDRYLDGGACAYSGHSTSPW